MAGDHLTDVPIYMTYSSAVSRDKVRIGYLVAALNNLDVLSGDIQNSFLEAPTKEKIFFYAGDECNYDKDKVVIVVQSSHEISNSNFITANSTGIGHVYRNISKVATCHVS